MQLGSGRLEFLDNIDKICSHSINVFPYYYNISDNLCKYANCLIKHARYKNVPSRNEFYMKNYPKIRWEKFGSDHSQIVTAFALSNKSTQNNAITSIICIILISLASGVTSAPADPAMRGARGPRGPKIMASFFHWKFHTAIFVRTWAAMSKLLNAVFVHVGPTIPAVAAVSLCLTSSFWWPWYWT